MASSRTPVLRKSAAADELAALNPIERTLVRVFEFCSSVKLAITLMIWLMIECTIGTFVESQVNTPAAQYFVYSSWHFVLLLSLLFVNILCAALIRFPWKKYQTGFVVTHLGLLTMLVGSMMTYRNNLDALMRVRKDESENVIFDPSQEELVVRYVGASGKQQEHVVPVDFGPYTWGHKILDLFPWRKGRVEEFKLPGDITLRVKQFLANCAPERIFVPSEEGVHGVPAIRYRLNAEGRFDFDKWMAVDPEHLVQMEEMAGVNIIFWEVDSLEELDHLANAVPKDSSESQLGILAYSNAGKHHFIKVEDLKKGPQTIELPSGEKAVIELAALLNNPVPRGGELVDEGTDPVNPALKLKLTVGGRTSEHYTFGIYPQFTSLMNRRARSRHFFSYYPAQQHAGNQIISGPNGKFVYRGFNSRGTVANTYAEIGKEYPSWGNSTFTFEEMIPVARPDYKLRPKQLKKGDRGIRGAVVELDMGKGKVFKTSLLLEGPPRKIPQGDRMVEVGYQLWRHQVPFKVRLDDFEEPKQPGTRKAAMYTSLVTVFDDARSEPTKQKVTMNYPLFYTASDGKLYTFYQSDIARDEGDVPISTFTVANDPGLITKYVGASVMSIGIVLMFYMGGYFNKGSKSARSAKPTETESLSYA